MSFNISSFDFPYKEVIKRVLQMLKHFLHYVFNIKHQILIYKKIRIETMKAMFVNESLNEYESYDDDRYDEGEDDDSTTTLDDSVLTSADDEEEDEYIDDEINDEFQTLLDNELKVPEYARREVSFRVKGEPGTIDAVPMAKMKDGSFLMKINGRYRKFKMSDIIEEDI